MTDAPPAPHPHASTDASAPAVPAAAHRPLRIDVWSDIACPWCWLGKHHLQAALQETGVDAEVVFHAYELQPERTTPRQVQEYMATERTAHTAAMAAGQERLVEMGRQVGIHYDFTRQLMVNTFDAHRVHRLAETSGRGGVVLERLMQAVHGEGEDVSDHATLRRLAVEAGLDAAAVDAVLAGDRFADAVRQDEAAAVQVGVRGVPFFVFDERFALSGAQPVAVFVEVLQKAAEADATSRSE